ncbi:MAG: hypothetical protein ABI045_04645 [Flavobacteriales bacterium]
MKGQSNRTAGENYFDVKAGPNYYGVSGLNGLIFLVFMLGM